MRYLHVILLLLAFLCFVLTAVGLQTTVPLVPLGLALFTLDQLLRSLPYDGH